MDSSNADEQPPEGSAQNSGVPPRMSTNSPPAIFIAGLVSMPVAFMLCLQYVPAPLTWPAAITGVIMLGFTTRWLTARQVRKEADRAKHAKSIPPE